MLSIVKLQNLKAIHNLDEVACCVLVDVINHKTTKFESNSQRYSPYEEGYIGCYQSQNYKIWKQFTTNKWMKQQNKVLLSIAKLQNLKAIHNSRAGNWKTGKVVINHKTTKFESNSQLQRRKPYALARCYQSQNYKIWKQFITVRLLERLLALMLSITKLQNLKAIHNS